MNTKATKESRRHGWRMALLLLVVLPFLPEIIIYATAAVAKAGGCLVDDDWVCWIAGVRVSDVVAHLLRVGVIVAVGFGYGIAAAWLALCYLAITRGWARLISRLLLALLVSVIFAFLPYLAPALAIAPLVNTHCEPNEGGVGRCEIFGGDVGSAAHETVIVPWLIFVGVPIAFGAVVIYAIVAAIIRVVAARRVAASVQ